ncbi:unnamed protein product [Gordionus sp. m RMFG-2023]
MTYEIRFIYRIELSSQYKERIEKIVFADSLTIFIALGIIGNIFYLLCTSNISTDKYHTYIYIRTLIITDFSICITLIIWPTYFFSDKSRFVSPKLYILLMGKYILPIQDSLMYFSNLLRVLISLDRVTALGFPIFYNKQSMQTKIKYLLLICAVISVGSAFPATFTFIVVKLKYHFDTLNGCSQYTNHTLTVIPLSLINTTRYVTYCYAMQPNQNAAWLSTSGFVNNISMFVLPVMIIVIANTTVIILSIKYYRKRLRINNQYSNSSSVKMSLDARCNFYLKKMIHTIYYHIRPNEHSASGKLLLHIINIKVSPTLPMAISTNSINRRTPIRNRELKITLSMMGLSTQFVICMLPLILYVFKYHYSWSSSITSFNTLWFQSIAHILKLSNYCLSVYVSLASDPTVLKRINKYIKRNN